MGERELHSTLALALTQALVLVRGVRGGDVTGRGREGGRWPPYDGRQ